MRGLIDGLPSPHPLSDHVPAIICDDDLCTRILAAFDAVLAPIFCVLDNLDAYVDPRLTPDDFLAWLGTWVGVTIEESWPIGLRRALVRSTAPLDGTRGTASTLRQQIATATGGVVDVEDGGFVRCSRTPRSAQETADAPQLRVRVHVADPMIIDPAWIESLVAGERPSHVPHLIEVALQTEPTGAL